MKNKNKKFISYDTLIRNERTLKNLSALGVELYYRKSIFKLVLGATALIIAIIPNGLGGIFYPLGFSLLASAGVDLYALKSKLFYKLRFLKWSLKTTLKCNFYRVKLKLTRLTK